MKFSSSPKLNQSGLASKSTPISSALQQAKTLAMRFGTRALIGASLVADTVACSDDVSVSSRSQFADAGGHIDSSVLNGADSSSADAGKSVLPCSPTPYCPNPKMSSSTPWLDDLYLTQDRWFRVDPTTKEIYKICEPIQQKTCDENKGETPSKDHCDLPICPDAKMCDPIPSIKSATDPFFPRDFTIFPTGLYISPYNPPGGYTPLPTSENPYAQPIIFDNTPDCLPGQTPAGESYMVCDLIPTCEKTIPYCEPLPRCEPGQPVVTFGTYQKAEALGLGISSSIVCKDIFAKNTTWISSGYNISLDSAFETICAPVDALNKAGKIQELPTTVTVNCLPTRACTPGEVPKSISNAPLLPIDTGLYGVVMSPLINPNYGGVSCEPIPSCSKK